MNKKIKRSCYDCWFIYPTSVSWWCSNEDAIEARGTSIPSEIDCPFWKKEEPGQKEGYNELVNLVDSSKKADMTFWGFGCGIILLICISWVIIFLVLLIIK